MEATHESDQIYANCPTIATAGKQFSAFVAHIALVVKHKKARQNTDKVN
ncbi:hypothetical protein ACMGGR_15805 [Erwinia sp. BNK-24-b]|nr:hypothetical protein [Erwinia phyllosphaerae]MBV4366087.1 hypothetical protein [Erwinia phyllosphaerae]